MRSGNGRVAGAARKHPLIVPGDITLPFHHTRRAALGTLLAALCLAGCNSRSAPVLALGAKPQAESQHAAREAPTTVPAKSAAGPAPIDPQQTSAKGHPKQSWEAVYAYGAKIGWGHTAIVDVEEAGQRLVQIDNDNHLSVDRQGQRTAIEISSRSIETPTGQLVRFTTEVNAGPSRTAIAGKVADGSLRIETSTQGKVMSETVPLPSGTLGFNATEQSLAGGPLLPGERRTLKALMPATNEVVTIDLAADKYEPTALLDHTEDLLRVDSTITLPIHQADDKPAVIRSQLWSNAQGQILKTSVAALHQDTYRTTKEVALASAGPRRLDLVVDNTIPAPMAASDPHGTQRVRYRLRLDSDDPAKVFYSGPLQEIVPQGPHTAEVIVRRCVVPSADSGVTATSSAAPARRPPVAEDRSPNNLIQSDDEEVQKLARSVAPDETDPWKLAVALEKFVNQKIEMKNFTQAFSTAAEVARNPEGDCTEHAVLLAALARARGIPARVAIGLVYQPASQSFAYHMWNELWITDRWVPMDATLGRGGIGAAHLKLTDSNLAGTQAYSCFLPVAQVIGQLKIEVLEIE